MSQRTTDDETNPETTRTNRTDRRDSRGIKWLSGLASLLGLWIAASPFLYESTQIALWNNVIVGMTMFLLAGYNYYRLTKGHRLNMGAASLVALLGLWSVLAPFLFEFDSQALASSTMASGLAIALLSGYNAYRSRQTETETTTGTRA